MEVDGVDFGLPAVAAACRRHAVRRLWVFGSLAERRLGPASDVDLMVEFEPGRTPGLVAFAALQEDLSEALRRAVHLHTAAMIPEDRRPARVLEAWTAHAA